MSYSVPAQLTPYFLEGKFKADLNRRNVLGTGGRLTEAYSELLKKIWSASYTTIAPREFKAVLGKHAPQFAGFQQHDSQVSSLCHQATH